MRVQGQALSLVVFVSRVRVRSNMLLVRGFACKMIEELKVAKQLNSPVERLSLRLNLLGSNQLLYTASGRVLNERNPLPSA
jgi:hypothetical protein